jgi:acyl-CoA thioesterase FadM
MAYFIAQRQTQFAESDAAGIIHFSRLAVYVEEAEHLFFQKEGLPINLKNPESYRWPRVRYSANYLHPVFPMEMIQIELNPVRVGTSSITWQWEIWRQERSEQAAKGEMKSVCCKWSDGQILPHALPEGLRTKLTTAG